MRDNWNKLYISKFFFHFGELTVIRLDAKNFGNGDIHWLINKNLLVLSLTVIFNILHLFFFALHWCSDISIILFVNVMLWKWYKWPFYNICTFIYQSRMLAKCHNTLFCTIGKYINMFSLQKVSYSPIS